MLDSEKVMRTLLETILDNAIYSSKFNAANIISKEATFAYHWIPWPASDT